MIYKVLKKFRELSNDLPASWLWLSNKEKVQPKITNEHGLEPRSAA